MKDSEHLPPRWCCHPNYYPGQWTSPWIPTGDPEAAAQLCHSNPVYLLHKEWENYTVCVKNLTAMMRKREKYHEISQN